MGAEHLDEFGSIGTRMQVLSTAAGPAVSSEAAALCEALQAFTWKLLLPAWKARAAREHIEASRDSAQYFLNRILQQAKQDSAPNKSSAWCQALQNVFKALLVEASDNYPSDVKPKADLAKSSTAPTNPKAANPNTRAPEVALQGNRWVVEKGINWTETICIQPESMGQAVLVERCEGLRVHIQGKVAAVIVSRCRGLHLEVQDCVSGVEAMGLMESELVLRGNVPTVVLDGSEAVRVHMLGPGAGQHTQILSSKCAEINLLVPEGSDQTAEEPLMREIALPFQFRSSLLPDGSLATEAVKHAGA